MAVVMCHTEDCSNAGHAIELDISTYDDEGQKVGTVDAVACGVCGQEITDIQ